jgi:hypothetical protein
VTRPVSRKSIWPPPAQPGTSPAGKAHDRWSKAENVKSHDPVKATDGVVGLSHAATTIRAATANARLLRMLQLERRRRNSCSMGLR